MVFATRTSYPKTRVPSKAGSGVEPIFVKAFDEKGEPYLEKHGQKNVYDIIQAHYDDTRIQSIVARYEAGDNSVLGKVQGFYADLTQSAATLQDALNSSLKVKAFYDRMPADVKKKFDTVQKFVTALGTDELKDMILPKKPEKAEPPKPVETPKEVNADVTK